MPFGIAAQCEHPDYAGLMDLYDSTNGDEWFSHDGWKQGKDGTSCDPCDFNGGRWAFVSCSNGRVTKISFPQNNLNGTIPDFALDTLLEFVIDNNNLVDGFTTFFNAPNITRLTIARSELSGTIPDLKELIHLEYLELTDNKLTGSIPNFDLPNLSSLLLGNNQLTGAIPNFNLPSLRNLVVVMNNLSGELPKFENLALLTSFDCSVNEIEGPFHNFVDSPILKMLRIQKNRFTGSIPDFKDHPQLSKITFLANDNDFTGCYPASLCDMSAVNFNTNYRLPFRGDFSKICDGSSKIGAPCSPAGVGSFGILDENCDCIPVGCEYYEADVDALIKFYESTNGQDWLVNFGWTAGATGQSCFPCDWSNQPWYGVKCVEGKVVAIDLDGSPDFTNLGVGGNNLIGPMTDLNLENLQELYLDDNLLSGEVPAFQNAANIETLILSRNNISGSLPNFADYPNIKVFRGSFNNFSGTLPDLSNLDSIKTFTCSNNDLEGCYDQKLCSIGLVDLNFNEALPWSGDFLPFCSGEDEVGAPCNLSANEDYVINENCECVLFTSNTDDLELKNMEVFPNPASDFININTQFENVTFTIFSSEGKKLISSKHITIDVSGLPRGIYFISVEEEINATIKFYKI